MKTYDINYTTEEEVFLKGEAFRKGKNPKIIKTDRGKLTSKIIEEINRIKDEKNYALSEVALIFPFKKYRKPINYYVLKWLKDKLEENNIDYSLLVKDGKNYPCSIEFRTGVNLVTVNSALGLDFDVVLFCGLLPMGYFHDSKTIHKKQKDDITDEMKEEFHSNINKIYTAVTRARQELVIFLDDDYKDYDSIYNQMIIETLERIETNDQKNKYNKFAEQIVNDYINKVTGQKQEYIVGNLPSRKIFAGKLMTENEEENYYSSKKNLNVKSLEFSISEKTLKKGNIEIEISGNLYYRSLPTYKQQKEKYIKNFNKRNNLDINFEEIIELNKSKNRDVYNFSKIKIEDVFRKFKFKPLKKKIALKKLINRDNLKISLEPELDDLKDKLLNREDSYIKINDKLGIEEIRDKENYKEFLKLHKNSFEDNRTRPNWDFTIYIDKKKINNNYLISIRLINLTKDNNMNTYKSNLVFDSTLYNSKIKVILNNGDFNNIDLSHFKNDYKYEINNYSLSNANSIEYGPKENSLTTVNIPRYKQYRTKTNNNIKVKFVDLTKAPIKFLRDISKKMKRELETRKNDYQSRKNNLIDDKKHLKAAQKQFEEELNNFENEINRFDYGIKLLEKHTQLKKAFELMNKTFQINSQGYDSWRLFQIVFIVLQIPDIAVSEYTETIIDRSQIDKVDLLHFPTGGGKTEAFLGVSIFTLFFDRIRDKDFGNSIIIKYPLRLLSVQQLDRLMKLLVVAEKIRKEEKITGGEKFSLGYYVGKKNTPNNLEDRELEKVSSLTDESLENEYKIIDKCPVCSEKLKLELEASDNSINHICTNNSCEIDKLPLYIVDYQIYAKLPSIIIATVDKLAAVGYNKRFQKILGRVKNKCEKHGYFNVSRCPLCDKELISVNSDKASPSLLIQDEVHLLNESLGVYASHYEKFIDYYLSNLQDKKIKHIAATATVSGADPHLLHLYGKDNNLFPCKTPDKDRNFYSHVDKEDISRFIIGHTSYGIGYIDTVVYALQYLKEIIWKYRDNFELVRQIEGLNEMSNEEIIEMLKYYWLVIQYNNIKIDTNKVSRAINDPVNIELKEKGIQEYDSTKMTGDETFQEIRGILEKIEKEDNAFENENLINATSTISHGVDIDRANVMVFNGMPKHNSEYIQAYSRVGRKYTGIVIDIIRSTREKDMSYLKNFHNFHKLKDILVENVPINTWAMNSIHNTFPGILSGLLINYYIDEFSNIYMMQELKNVINYDLDNECKLKKEIKNHIKKIYKCINGEDEENIDGKYFNTIIDKKIDYFYEEMEGNIFSDNVYILDGFKSLENINRPMFSLRDTGKQINIGVE